MAECSCSIFNTREEKIIEDDGRILRRLICNICGKVLDCKEEPKHRRCLSDKNSKSGGEESVGF